MTRSLRTFPPPLLPFEYLVGRWNGQGVPKDNPAKQFRGWTETHTWAWVFAQGKPVGLAVTIEGGKVLATGKLTYDAAAQALSPRSDRAEAAPEAGSASRARSTGRARPGARSIAMAEKSAKVCRDVAVVDLAQCQLHPLHDDPRSQGAGLVQFTRLIEVGLTRDGESLAAGATTTERPKCIVTGGAATMTSATRAARSRSAAPGCRDEFNENPEKYIKKASLMLGSQGGKPKSGQPRSLPREPVRRRLRGRRRRRQGRRVASDQRAKDLVRADEAVRWARGEPGRNLVRLQTPNYAGRRDRRCSNRRLESGPRAATLLRWDKTSRSRVRQRPR